ncbi:Tyrosine decarboxylase 2 [Turnera subulata]|uniref:Tyrosine decarboxylase 2 n=1 Tax=Turnera subulata TaxID=218843 RepID=A0A9Q0FFE4_9ROSI|nr:Tyrosine decarboxylase 2 [Turnera subulata]
MGSLPTNAFSPLVPGDFSQESKKVIDFIADYYSNIENYPVLSQVKPGYLKSQLPDSAPNSPEPLEDILKDIDASIIPGLTHWQSPNFYAYFQVNASTAGFLGEMLCSGFNVVNFGWITSPAATELETLIMDWVAKMLELPPQFMSSGNGGGVLHSSTCEAIVCTLAAARDKVLTEVGYEAITKLVVYSSDQTHSCLQKGVKLVGIGPSNLRCLPTAFSEGFSLSPQTLEDAIQEDIKSGLVPLYLCGTVGTTACGAVDPIEKLGEVARKYKLWFHIDAAYAGSACICPEFRHYLNGVELADSFSMNAHKWFLTNMDCCCLWVKNPDSLINSLSTNPEYLRNAASESLNVIDYKDWQIALSRRFRALKLWVVIRRHGVATLRFHIRSDVNLACCLESLVARDSRFELVAPRKFALVCFRLKAGKKNNKDDESLNQKLNKKLLQEVNESGNAYMIHSVIGGVYFIRCAVGSTLTEERHVAGLWKLIQEKATEVLLNTTY